MRREVTPEIVRHVDITGNWEGLITYSRLDEANVEATIGAQIEYYEKLGQDFEWKYYDYDQPPELKDRLSSFGFTPGEAEATMVLDLANAPERLWQPIRHDVRRITVPESLSDLVRVEEQVWEEDSTSIGNFLVDALRNTPDLMHIYVAYKDEKPISAAWVYFQPHSRFASLWGGATLRDYRKQGFYTELLAVRAQEARAHGVSYLTVDASPMSRPILERFGFNIITYSYPCKWKCQHGK